TTAILRPRRSADCARRSFRDRRSTVPARPPISLRRATGTSWPRTSWISRRSSAADEQRRICPHQTRGIAVHISLAHGAWLDHDPRWLSPEESDRTLAAVRDEMTWEHREIVIFGRRILQPRLIAWGGDLGYRYSGQTIEPRAFTPTLQGLLTRVSA